jgi:hypothetical protein
MPVDKSRVDRMIKMMDDFLKQREDDKLNGYDDEDEDTDPRQFLDPPHRTLPVAESPDIFQENSAPSQIHKSKDLFN